MVRGQAFVPQDITKPVFGRPEGPLAGLTFAVKDMYAVTGERVSAGHPDWLASAQAASGNAPIIQKLLDYGATLIGKTICDELFYSVTGMNSHYGAPRNPRAIDRIAGGSSSGSASAVASGACDFALGSDTSGSIRVPASFCGIYGIRPTHGRVDCSGILPMAPSFDVPGWFASGPGTFCNLGSAILNSDSVDAPLERAILLEEALLQADETVGEMVRLSLMEMDGEIPRPSLGSLATLETIEIWRDAFRIVQAYETWQNFGPFVVARKPQLGDGVKERMSMAQKVTRSEEAAARSVVNSAKDKLRILAKPGTIFVLPTTASIAPLKDMTFAEAELFRTRTVRLTCIAGIGGLPQISIPIGTISGCPIGLSIIGWSGGDEVLLKTARNLSRFCGREL